MEFIDQLLAQLKALPLPGIEIAGLPVELSILALAIALGLFQLMLAARFVNSQRGVKWNLGARDGEPPPASAFALRLDRAYRNFMETFPFFAAAILLCFVTNRFGWLTLIGSQLYFIARVVYLPLYAFGVPGIRTLVWLVALIGLVMTIAAIFITPG